MPGTDKALNKYQFPPSVNLGNSNSCIHNKKQNKKHILCARHHSRNSWSLQPYQKSKIVLCTAVIFHFLHIPDSSRHLFVSTVVPKAPTHSYSYTSARPTNSCTPPSLLTPWICCCRILNGEYYLCFVLHSGSRWKPNVTDRFDLTVPVSDHRTIQNPSEIPPWPHNGHKADRLKSVTAEG